MLCPKCNSKMRKVDMRFVCAYLKFYYECDNCGWNKNKQKDIEGGEKMNKGLEDYARKLIKEGLVQLPENWQIMFKRMYSHDNLDIDINTLVDNMPEDKLDWAMQQVEKSLRKITKEGGE